MNDLTRPRIFRAVAATVLGIGLLVSATGVSSAQVETPAYDASASADGVRITVEVPGAPLTSRLVDTGGPTAQVAVNSLGTSRGYSAMPDPGELVTSGPGLLVGLVNQGAAGLPPIDFPSLPEFPLKVASDAGGTRRAQIGSGPYELETTSEPNRSKAKGLGGLTTPGGNLARVESLAEAGVESDGGVVSTAFSDFQGLSVGPLSIGRVRSSATMTLDTSGRVERAAELDVDGFRIGGVELEIAAGELRIAGQAIPLPLEDTLQTLLGVAGFDVEYQAGEEFEDSVIAPTLTLTTEVGDLGIGTGDGTMTITLGGATAALTGAPIPPIVTPPPVDPVSAGAPQSAASGLPTTGSTSAPGPVASPASAQTPAAASPPALDTRQAAAALSIFGDWDVLPTYLTLAGATALMYAVSQLIRLLGVRLRWN